MKISSVLNGMLAVAVGVLAVSLLNRESAENEGGQTAIENIMTRTSVRSYTDKAVDAATVETLLRAGMAAPTAKNQQPWDFMVVRDRALLQSLADSLPYAKMTAEAPLAIVVCGNLQKSLPGASASSWIMDTSAATENILLAAHSLGLGAVWTGVHPYPERIKAVRTVLGIPSHIVPLCVIPVGYPAETPVPKDKWKPENVHYDSWGVHTEQ